MVETGRITNVGRRNTSIHPYEIHRIRIVILIGIVVVIFLMIRWMRAEEIEQIMGMNVRCCRLARTIS